MRKIVVAAFSFIISSSAFAGATDTNYAALNKIKRNGDTGNIVGTCRVSGDDARVTAIHLKAKRAYTVWYKCDDGGNMQLDGDVVGGNDFSFRGYVDCADNQDVTFTVVSHGKMINDEMRLIEQITTNNVTDPNCADSRQNCRAVAKCTVYQDLD